MSQELTLSAQNTVKLVLSVQTVKTKKHCVLRVKLHIQIIKFGEHKVLKRELATKTIKCTKIRDTKAHVWCTKMSFKEC